MPAGVMCSVAYRARTVAVQASKQAHGLVQREGELSWNAIGIELQVQAQLQRHGPVLLSIHSCVRGVSLRLGTGQRRMLVDGLTMRRGNWLVFSSISTPTQLSTSSLSLFFLCLCFVFFFSSTVRIGPASSIAATKENGVIVRTSVFRLQLGMSRADH